MSQGVIQPIMAHTEFPSAGQEPAEAERQILELDISDQPQQDRANFTKLRTVTTLAVLVLDVLMSSFTSGTLTASLPLIAKSLSLPAHLLLWPSSVNALTSASTLLLAGSIGDLLGSKRVWLTGSVGLGLTILACGLSRSGTELIVFRAVQGVASSFCVTTSASLVTHTVPAGRGRNLAFGCLGLSFPFGFSVGLVLGGVLAQELGWRVAWYASAVSFALISFCGFYALPMDHPVTRQDLTIEKLNHKVDWIGAAIATTSLAMLSYALAVVSADVSEFKKPKTLVALILSLSLAPVSIWWMGKREKQHKTALIPNSIWRSRSFTTVCIMILCAFGIEDAMELLSSLYFQNVQMTGALDSSLRMLPMGLVGMILSISVGLLIHSLSATTLVLFASLLSAASPLLMALGNPKWPYWYSEFPSQLLMPISIDIQYTVGIILASEIFPEDRQALAAGVFNTAAQLGISVGLGIVGVVSRSVTLKSSFPDKGSSGALLVGYRAAFWTAFAWTLTSCAIGVIGLTKLGKVGVKRD